MNAAKTTKPEMSCAHSNGKPGVPAPMIKLDVRFAPVLTVPLTIKNKKNYETNHDSRNALRRAVVLPDKKSYEAEIRPQAGPGREGTGRLESRAILEPDAVCRLDAATGEIGVGV